MFKPALSCTFPTNGVIADGEKEVSATGSNPRMPGTLLDASPDPRVGRQWRAHHPGQAARLASSRQRRSPC